MNIDIRLLGNGDADVLSQVAEDVFDHDIIPEQAVRYLADPAYHLAVALDDGLVVGMCSGNEYWHPDKPTQFWVNEMGVSPQYQRRGIGRRLLNTMLGVARDRGCREVWLGTENDNEPARALYRSAGGKEEQFVMYTFDLSDGK
jgi:ribosomal protein S18 acetylase RimI-like enzyme